MLTVHTATYVSWFNMGVRRALPKSHSRLVSYLRCYPSPPQHLPNFRSFRFSPLPLVTMQSKSHIYQSSFRSKRLFSSRFQNLPNPRTSPQTMLFQKVSIEILHFPNIERFHTNGPTCQKARNTRAAPRTRLLLLLLCFAQQSPKISDRQYRKTDCTRSTLASRPPNNISRPTHWLRMQLRS